MARKKKTKTTQGGGMAGKSHPKDSNDQTALAWAYKMRQKYPAPDGGKIKAKFPNGPEGGTWSKTRGQFRAWLNDERVGGVFKSWKEAHDVLHEAAGSSPSNGAEEVAAKHKGNGRSVTRGEISRVIASMAADGGDLQGSLNKAADELRSKGDDLTKQAEEKKHEAEVAYGQAKALEKAAQAMSVKPEPKEDLQVAEAQ